MKKARKLSLQSLALVLMAFVLVAGVAFGMTGAWFTQRNNVTKNSVNFGNIELNVNESVDGKTFGTLNYGTTRNFDTGVAMPGDNISYSLEVTKTGTNAFWYVVEITATITKSGAESAANTFSSTTAVLDSEAIDGTQGKGLFGGVMQLTGDAFGNDYENAVIAIGYDVRAIQKANVTQEQATALLVTNWSSANKEAFVSGEVTLAGAAYVPAEG